MKTSYISYTSPIFLILLLVLLASARPARADSSDWVQVQRFERQLAKARDGKVSAMYEVGRMYERGRGVDINFAEAVNWFEKASAGGNAPAKARLGILYFEGRGVSQDHEKAYQLFKEAANENIPSAEYQLGLMYEWGTAVPQDRNEALKWYTKAKAHGDYRAENKIRQLKASVKKAPRPATTASAAAKPADTKNTSSAAKPAGKKSAPVPTTPAGVLAAILQGQWSEGDLDAAVLPSKSSECSVKDSQIFCRGKQERSTTTEIIVFESESVLSDFNKTRFKLSYTNTAIEVKPKKKLRSGPMGENDSGPVTGNIKPGQKTRPRELDCEMIKGKRIKCSRDNIPQSSFDLAQ